MERGMECGMEHGMELGIEWHVICTCGRSAHTYTYIYIVGIITCMRTLRFCEWWSCYPVSRPGVCGSAWSHHALLVCVRGKTDGAMWELLTVFHSKLLSQLYQQAVCTDVSLRDADNTGTYHALTYLQQLVLPKAVPAQYLDAPSSHECSHVWSRSLQTLCGVIN